MKTMIIIGSLVLAASVLAISTIGCSKARKAGGEMDTPEVHYKQGMKYWDDAQYAKAEEEFKLAQSLDPKYAPAVSGLALVTAEKAKHATDVKAEENGYDDAMKLADKGVSLNDKIPETFIARGMVKTMKFEGKKPAKDWLDDVERDYNKALKVDPNCSEAYYRRGVCYKKAYEFGKAADDFKKVLDLDKGYTVMANEEWELVQKIERAAPGTEVGKRIALIDKIGRADVAALFMSELSVDKLVKKRRPVAANTGFEAPNDPRQMQVQKTVAVVAPVTDMDGHWAKNFVGDIVQLDIRGLEPYPDHTFHPDDPVNRGAFAMMVEDIIMAITGDQALATKYIGTTSRFPDVNPSHPAYNAICTAVDRNVMDAAINGVFNPEGSVSGADALLTIRRIKDLNKIGQ